LIVSNISDHDKQKIGRLRPSGREGAYIRYALLLKDERLVFIARRLNVSHQFVVNVVLGYRRSARVEAEIVRILEKNDWNEVVMEARSAVSGKSVATLAAEEKRRLKARDVAQKEALRQALGGARRAG
jgi:hypothetical protein